MNSLRLLINDPAPRQHRASWYVPGPSDGLGDRLLMFDNTGAPALELLRFKREFADTASFEAALRQRLSALGGFSHPAIAPVRAVQWLEAGEGLALVSNQTAGRRLSEVLREDRGLALAVEVVRQVTPALVALHAQGPGVTHGALTPERIILTPEGRLVVVEHVLGSALESLHLPPSRLRSEVGIAVPSGRDARFDSRTDVIQLAWVALSLLLGRRLDPADYPDACAGLLEEFPWDDPRGGPLLPRLRTWLGRALQIAEGPFESAQDAEDACRDWPTGNVPRLVAPGRTLPMLATLSQPAGSSLARRALDRLLDGAALASGPGTGLRKRAGWWVAAAFAALTLVEAIVIARLERTRPPTGGVVAALTNSRPSAAPATQDNTQHDQADPPAPAGRDAKTAAPGSRTSAGAGGATTSARLPTSAANPIATSEASSAASTNGWVSFKVPIELEVREGSTLIGATSAERLPLPAGRHNLQLVNTALDYQTTFPVQVPPGQTIVAALTLPNGSLSVDASPWANVFVDGRSVGPTPVASLELPIGTHEILWRHPQLGERRQTVQVTAKTPVRVAVDLNK